MQHVEDGRQLDSLGQRRLARIAGLDLGGVTQRVAGQIGGTGTQLDAVEAQSGRRHRPSVRWPPPFVGVLDRLCERASSNPGPHPTSTSTPEAGSQPLASTAR